MTCTIVEHTEQVVVTPDDCNAAPIVIEQPVSTTVLVESAPDVVEVNAGPRGYPGKDGWAPITAIIADGARRVMQITDWTGGTGTKPATGYVGATGLVAAIGDAVDLRGATGAAGSITSVNGKTGAAVTLTAADVGAATAAQGVKADAAIPAAQKGVANGVATLDAGSKIPESQLPAIAITDTTVVASQAAMLALVAERGDIAVRSDINKSFVLAAEPATTLANWIELRTPTDAVLSVAGKTGAVALVPGDVGAAPATAILTDAAASNTLPATSSSTLASLLQTVRDCLKWLLAKTDVLSIVTDGTANTFTLASANNAVPITANTTIPTNASVAYPVGTCILLTCSTTARTITGPASSSLTVEGAASAVTSFTLKANKSVLIRKTGADAWRVYGDV